MSTRPALGRIYDALASLRLAVVVMVTLATTCLLATLYESRHGTPAVQRDVYRTWWFALILTALATNIFCAMMKRYPWKAHHAGFVTAHIGILTLLAGSLLSLRLGLDGNMALFEGETSDHVALVEKALQVALPDGAHGTFPVGFEKRPPGPGREQRFPVPGTQDVLVAEDFQPHVGVVDGFAPDASGPPALHFVLVNAFATQDAWLSQAGDHGHAHFGPLSVHLRGASAEAEQEDGNTVTLGIDGGQVAYAIRSRDGSTRSGALAVGAPLTTPWMGMTLTVDQLLPHAAAEQRLQPATPPANEERRLPAVKVRLEGPQGKSPSQWLAWSDTRRVAFAGGSATVGFRAPEVIVPFRVTLLDFDSQTYPGSSMAATYESQVRIDDPERGVSQHRISMNHPLHYRGYIFFQASFVKGEPMMSILSVARSPGLPLVYVGVVLIACGVIWMFYVKPYLARRQGLRALAARRALESSHEARSSDPVPQPAGAAEPAPSRA